MLLPEDGRETTVETKRLCHVSDQNQNGCTVKKEEYEVEETGVKTKTTTTMCFCGHPYCNTAGLKMPSFYVILATVVLVKAMVE